MFAEKLTGRENEDFSGKAGQARLMTDGVPATFPAKTVVTLQGFGQFFGECGFRRILPLCAGCAATA